jgi:hypothetical protein
LVRYCSPPDPRAPSGLLVFADPAGSLLAPTSSHAAESLVPLLAPAMDEAAAAAAKAAEDHRLTEYEAAHEAVWAQATTVVNVKALIPIILDKATNTYTKWRGIFLTVLGKYALTRHVLDDEVFPERPAWLQADCVVLTWIYGTVSGDLQQSLLIHQRPAREAWCYLEDEFLGQKESRAPWYIVTTLVPYISLAIQCSISRRSMLRLISIFIGCLCDTLCRWSVSLPTAVHSGYFGARRDECVQAMQHACGSSLQIICRWTSCW